MGWQELEILFDEEKVSDSRILPVQRRVAVGVRVSLSSLERLDDNVIQSTNLRPQLDPARLGVTVTPN
jgi:hypothetical protein